MVIKPPQPSPTELPLEQPKRRRWFCSQKQYFIGIIPVMLLIGYFGEVLYHWNDKPTIKVDYLAKITEQAVVLSPDLPAWPLYRAALTETEIHLKWPDWYVYKTELADISTVKTRATPAERVEDPRPGEIGWAVATAWIKKNQSALEKLRLAGTRVQCGYRTFYSEDLSAEDRDFFAHAEIFIEKKTGSNGLAFGGNPHVSLFRKIARLLQLDTYAAAEEQDAERTFLNLQAQFNLVKHTREFPAGPSHLISLRLQKGSIRSLTWVLKQHPDLLSETQLKKLKAQIKTLDPYLGLARFLKGESYMIEDLIQRLYTDDGNGDGILTAVGIMTYERASVFNRSDIKEFDRIYFFMPLMHFAFPSRKQVLHIHERRSGLFAKSCEVSYGEYLKNESLYQITDLEGGLSSWISDIFFQNLNGMRVATAQYSGDLRGAEVGVALELYRRKYGDWPKSLVELTPQFLKTVPLDPFSGEPVKYSFVENQPVIYSVGHDLQDDGGRVGYVMSAGMPAYAPDCAAPGRKGNGDWILWSLVPENFLQLPVSEEDQRKATALMLEENRQIEKLNAAEAKAAENKAKAEN